jgi:hypothetical protein
MLWTRSPRVLITTLWVPIWALNLTHQETYLHKFCILYFETGKRDYAGLSVVLPTNQSHSNDSMILRCTKCIAFCIAYDTSVKIDENDLHSHFISFFQQVYPTLATAQVIMCWGMFFNCFHWSQASYLYALKSPKCLWKRFKIENVGV